MIPNVLYRRLYRAGFLFYAAQLVLALVFYRERTVFIDAAFHLFEIAKDGDLAIQNYRFGAAFTQAFPLTGVLAGASLTTVMMLYSASFIVMHGAAYWLCGNVLQAYRAALVLLVADALFATDTFFWIQSELPQGVALACLLFALAEGERMKNSALSITGLLLLSPVVAFMHPLLVFPITFWASYLLLKNPSADSKLRLVTLIGLYVASVVVKTFFFKTTYDSGAFGGLKNFADYFPDYFRLYANKRLLLRIAGPYILLPVAAIAVTAWGIRTRAWRRLAITAAFGVGYTLLINVSYPGPDVQAFYIENMYLPLGVMLGVPLVYDVASTARGTRRLAALLAGILLFAVLRFVAASPPFVQRLRWMRTLVAGTGNRKVILPSASAPTDLLKMDWGTAYEAWLLSTSEGRRSSSVLLTSEPEKLEQWLSYTAHFLGPWGPTAYTDLPKHYFRFSDTVTPYRITPAIALPPAPQP